MTDCDPMLIDSDTGKKYDFYKILGISEAEENPTVIKRAYFSAAQKYHPDKNKDGNDTTSLFIHVEEAYTTLSSPQERAYYNRNRAQILQTVDDAFDNVETFVNITALRRPQQNFYGVYDNAFSMLSEEEQKAAAIRLELDENLSDDERQRCTYRLQAAYPRFGGADAGKAQVSEFYAQWSSFSTVKIFSHADQYTTKGENSRYRKLAGGENERLRAEYRRIFSDKIKELTAYVQRRDDRILRFEASDLERQKQKEIEIRNERDAEKQQKQDAINEVFQQKEERKQQLEAKLADGTISQTELLEFENLSINNKALDKSVLKVAKELDQRQAKGEVKKKVTIQQLCPDRALIAAGADVDVNSCIYCKVCQERFSVMGEFKTHLNGRRHRRAVQDSESTAADSEQEPADLEAGVVEVDDESNALKRLEEELRRAQEDDAPQERPEPKAKDKREKRKKQESSERDPEDAQNTCRKCKRSFPSKSKLFDHLHSSGHAMVPK